MLESKENIILLTLNNDKGNIFLLSFETKNDV